MKNIGDWRPTKYVYRRGKLRSSRDTRQVGIASRLMVDCIAVHYDAQLKDFARGSLLDLGCGHVPLYAAYKDFVSDVTCIDWPATTHASPHLDYERDLTNPLGLLDESYDTIILSDVLEHIPEPEALFREMVRVLRPGGHIILNVPFYYWLHETPHDYYRYTEFALRRFAAELEIVRLDRIGGAAEILADVFSKNVQRVPVVGHGIAGAIQWMAGIITGSLLGKRIARATGDQFPLGYFMVCRKAYQHSSKSAS